MFQEPKWLDKKRILAIHTKQIQQFGGQPGVRDEGLLESALGKPLNVYFYSEVHPDIAVLAASYAYGIARNHPFLDGNKRTALVACRLFLRKNGFSMVASKIEKYETFLRLAEGLLSEEQLANWISEKTRPIEKRKQTARQLQET